MRTEPTNFEALKRGFESGEIPAIAGFSGSFYNRLCPPRKLSRIILETETEFLSLTIQEVTGHNSVIVPRGESHSLRMIEKELTIQRRAHGDSWDPDLHDPEWIRKCQSIDRDFDFEQLAPLVLTDLKPSLARHDPDSVFSLSHGDGSHRSLVYAVRLLRGLENFHPVEAIYFSPREF